MGEIADQLRGLIQQARSERKWLWCRYQDMWFSPDQLEEANRDGRFLWGPVNWQLRDPQERVDEARRRLESAEAEYERIRAKN